MKRNNMRKGVTLIELAVVLVIVGLLIGIAFKGFDLLKGSSVTAEANKIQKITSAVATFKSIYKRLPGDGCGTEAAPTSFCTGSADGVIDGSGTAEEDAAFWEELYLAGLITDADRRSELANADYGVDEDSVITDAHKGIYITAGVVPQNLMCELDQTYGDGVPAASKKDSGFMSSASTAATGNVVADYTASVDCATKTGTIAVEFLVFKN